MSVEQITCDVLVVGGGPGGYVCAIRAAQLGKRVAIVDAERFGGTCLTKGCIPSKALIHMAGVFSSMTAAYESMTMGIELSSPPNINVAAFQNWKKGVIETLESGVEFLLRKHKVQTLKGWARFEDGKTCVVESAGATTCIRASHVVLATGSSPRPLPEIPFSERVLDSSRALELDRIPEQLVLVGAGYIGLELGIAFRKLGSRITLIEAQDRILPGFDSDLSLPILNWLEEKGVDVHLNSSVNSISETGSGVTVAFSTAERGHVVDANYALINIGRQPNYADWGFENLCLDSDGPFLKVDSRCRTSMNNIWAIGDIAGEPQLAHHASAQGRMVAELISGERAEENPIAIPAVCFTEPEIVSVGLSPEQAKQAYDNVKIEKKAFSSVGKALAMDAETKGTFLRVVYRTDNNLILGIQAVGTKVSELANTFALALEMGACLEDVAGTIHAHPTLGEAFMEAAQSALDDQGFAAK